MNMTFEEIKSVVGDQQCRLILQQKEIALLKDDLFRATELYNKAAAELNKLTTKKGKKSQKK